MKLERWTLFAGLVGCTGCASADPVGEPSSRQARGASFGVASSAQQQGAAFDVFPTTDLSDGQSIALVLDGFASNTSIGVGQCRATFPATDCSAASYAATTDTTGHFSGRLTVFRNYTSMAGGVVSCALPGACIAGTSPLSDLSVSFREPLAFAEPRPRTVDVLPNPARVGETLRFFGTGWTPLASLTVSVCMPGSVPGACQGTTTTAFEGGSFSAQVAAPAFVTDGRRFVDCTVAPGACVGLVGEVANPAASAVESPLTIQGMPAASGTADLRVRGRNAESGNWVTRVRGRGFSPNRELLVLHCFGEDLSTCERQPSVTTDHRGRFEVCRELRPRLFDDETLDCQGGACALIIADPDALASSAVRLPLELRARRRAVSCP
jgi:hypothetical protein